MCTVEDLEFGETLINGSSGAQQGHHIGWNDSWRGDEGRQTRCDEVTWITSVYHNSD